MYLDGYFRLSNNKDFFLSIPAAIIQIIVKFLHFIALTWDWTNTSYHECERKLEPMPNTINSIRGAKEMGHATVIAKNVLSSKLYKRCYYEIRIENHENVDAFIGYIEYKTDGKYHFLQGLGCHENDYNEQFGAWITNCGRSGICRTIVQCTNNNWRHKAHGNLLNRESLIQDEELINSKWKNGDKIGIEINFEKNQSYIYCNDKFIGVFFEYLPKIVIPAVTIYHEGTVLSVPTFQLFKKQ